MMCMGQISDGVWVHCVRRAPPHKARDNGLFGTVVETRAVDVRVDLHNETTLDTEAKNMIQRHAMNWQGAGVSRPRTVSVFVAGLMGTRRGNISFQAAGARR